MRSELIYWLWLTIAFGPANSRKWNTMSHYGSVKEAYGDISRGNMSFVMPQDVRSVKSAKIEQAIKLGEYCKNKRINIYCFEDEKYPKRLREIYNPPSVLFAAGDISILNDYIVLACVGTRNPSEYSLNITDKICRELADAGMVIASGMASGLDTMALKAGIAAGRKVASVLPCGLFYDYPKDGAEIKRAVSRNGVVISEFFPDDKASSVNFHARNRILSGISMGTLITQAGVKSGALSTASFALAQGRDIFCIPPHELYSDDYAGVIRLIRDGAIPAFDARDVLNEYYSIYSHKLNHNSPIFRQKSTEGLFADTANKPAKASKPSAAAKKASPPPEKQDSPKPQVRVINTDGMSDEKKKIIEFVSENGAVHFDDIALLADWSEDVETMLTELELDGCIKSLSGNRYTI